ncbi:MAG: hypothetical protein VYC39_02670 [Myxococcota bacterium]|nr:hypothetical protein [Myxococcota bacterium]
MDVTVVTEDRYTFEKSSPSDWYGEQVLLEDQLLIAALEKRQLTVNRKSWSDKNFDWAGTRLAIFRSTWDYFDRLSEFTTWLSNISLKTQLMNPYDLIRWNMDKHYLEDLSTMNIPVVQTSFRAQGSTANLASWCKLVGGDEWVLKPVVSGAARNTFRINASTIGRHESIYRALISEEDMMLQPFLSSVPKHGEVSIVVINGSTTHAVLKKAKAGDYRVQDDFGGTVHAHIATPEEVDVAQKAVAVCEPKPLYARVDLVRDNLGSIVVSELELIEPELWFRNNPEAAERLADGVYNYLTSGSAYSSVIT